LGESSPGKLALGAQVSWFRREPTDRYLGAQIVTFALGSVLHLRSLALPLVALFAGLAWIAALRRARLIEITPTSRIASAAQGYVEITGCGEPAGGAALKSPLRAHPCLWYRYTIEEKSWYEKNWRLTESATSDSSFVVRDPSGICVVDPNSAQVHARSVEKWRERSRRYVEETLRVGEQIYVLGEFYTENPTTRTLNVKNELGSVLNEWKQNQPALRARFDANADGQIDQDEWRLARLAALQQVHAAHAKESLLPARHHMRAPRDRRPYLISGKNESRLAAHSDLSALLHMIWFGVTLVVALAYLTTAP
jgi:hypothetical protein